MKIYVLSKKLIFHSINGKTLGFALDIIVFFKKFEFDSNYEFGCQKYSKFEFFHKFENLETLYTFTSRFARGDDNFLFYAQSPIFASFYPNRPNFLWKHPLTPPGWAWPKTFLPQHCTLEFQAIYFL